MKEPTKRFVLISGGIGAGKTSLANIIGDEFGWEVGHEPVDSNPYLKDFYGDMSRWTFHLGMYFMSSRATQHVELASLSTSSVLDRSIYEDAHVFIPALKKLGFLTDTENEIYKDLWKFVSNSLPKPDVLIHLQASEDFLLRRIKERGRSSEVNIDLAYLELLDKFYTIWLAEYKESPLMVLDSEKYDFVNDEADRREVFRLISRWVEK